MSAAVSALLALASYQFVAAEREAGGTLVYDIPVWAVEAALPVGFAAIALRLLWRLKASLSARALALALAGALVAGVAILHPAPMPLAALIVLGVATVIGAPAFVTLGGVALILFWSVNQPIASIPVAHYSLVTNPSLPALPLFTAAGYFLAEGGAARRLIRVFRALLGNIAGGPAIVTVVVCAFFTSFTGASGVTILALGGLLMPVLRAAGYTEKNSLGLLTGAGSLGLLFPPCLPLILYAIIARVPIEQMFLAGILPGCIMLALLGACCVYQGRRGDPARQPFQWKEAGAALWDAKWELALPVVALGVMLSGLGTPVEAAAVTALYACVVETLIHRDIKVARDLPRVMSECGLLVGGVLVILGVALGLTNYMVDADVTARLLTWSTATIHSRWVFLLALNVFLLIVGCLMDIFSAIVIQVPLLVPLGAAFGIHPLHLGIIFLANLELGYLTPPIGLNLFLSSYRFNKPVGHVLRASVPAILVLSVGVLIITYVPWFTTALPRWLGH